MKRLLGLSFLALVACASPAETSTAPSIDSHATSHVDVFDGGVADSSRAYVIAMADEIDPTGLECDAIVLAPNLLMTARHCVANMDESNIVACADAGIAGAAPALKGDFDAKNFGFYADGQLAHAYGVHVASIIDEGRPDLCGSDIAFIVLDGNLDGVPTATLAPVGDAAKIGDVLSVVGWGSTSPTQSNDSDTLMERDDISVMAIGPTTVKGPTKSDSLFAGEIATSIGFCNGDSGGPALDANGHVVGIVSRAVHSCGTGPDVYTSPQAHVDLVTQAFTAAGLTYDPNGAPIDDAGDSGAQSNGASSSSSSSGCNASGGRNAGGSWLALACGLALAIATRRRRRPIC